MKKVLFLVIIFFISVSNVWATTSIENTLNSISDKIAQIKSTERTYSSISTDKYPVGSIYMSTSSTNPGLLFGGTWEAYATGRTLIGVSSDATVGTTGGTSTKSLTVDNLPTHTHSYTATGTIESTFTGTTANVDSNSASHNHPFPFINSSSIENTRGSGYFTGYGVFTSGGFGGRIMVNGSSSSITTASTSDSHSHTLTAAGTVASTYTGEESTSSSVGSGTSFNALNPYVTVYIWKRVS